MCTFLLPLILTQTGVRSLRADLRAVSPCFCFLMPLKQLRRLIRQLCWGEPVSLFDLGLRWYSATREAGKEETQQHNENQSLL